MKYLLALWEWSLQGNVKHRRPLVSPSLASAEVVSMVPCAHPPQAPITLVIFSLNSYKAAMCL